MSMILFLTLSPTMYIVHIESCVILWLHFLYKKSKQALVNDNCTLLRHGLIWSVVYLLSIVIRCVVSAKSLAWLECFFWGIQNAQEALSSLELYKKSVTIPFCVHYGCVDKTSVKICFLI